MSLLLLACGSGTNTWVTGPGAPRELEPIDTVLFTEGPFYDMGERAELILSSGRPNCETFSEATNTLVTDAGSTLYADEGIYLTLTALTLEADDDPEPLQNSAWEGTWTAETVTPERQVLLSPWVFHDAQLTALPEADLRLVFTQVDAARVTGWLESRWYSVDFEADHCGTMTTYLIPS